MDFFWNRTGLTWKLSVFGLALVLFPGGALLSAQDHSKKTATAHTASAGVAANTAPSGNGAAAAEKSTLGAPGNAAGSAQAANGAAPGQKTAPKPVTAAHLAALPEPLPASLTTGIDVQARSKDILAHLSEIIRFYRMTVTPIQKTGEPSDMLYAEQAQSTAMQIAQLAFQSGRDEAALLARIQVMPGVTPAQQPTEGEAQKLSAAQARITQQYRDLQTQAQSLDQQIAKAKAKDRAGLVEQRTNLQGQLELVAAAAEALAKVAGLSATQTNSGLQSDIDKLQHSVPEVIDGKIKPVANTIESIGSMRDAGVTTQAQVLFQLIGTEHAIDQRVEELSKLHDQAVQLRTPLINILRATMEAGRKLQEEQGSEKQGSGIGDQGSETLGSASAAGATKKTYDQLTDAFKTISGVSVPISQELLLLEQAKGNLMSWRAAVDAERKSIVHSLLLRVIFIAVALGIVLVLGEVWRRAVTRYVQDLRRRRQLLVIRRMAISFLSGLVLILGFVTQFSSLATFAGFITAGIAVGLQTVLLSVAAYFFIVGRYGVKVGDRITVSNVTGDVVEVGLVRFYLMELAGTGSELHPTGRIAVFANSVLFQTGTPLYKQIPGTNYAWHEVRVKLKPGVNYEPATKAIRGTVEEVYSSYKAQIEREHRATEAWMDTSLPSPAVECRLELTDGLQYAVLFPVQIGKAADTDEKVITRLVDLMGRDESIAQAVDGAPVLKAVVKA